MVYNGFKEKRTNVLFSKNHINKGFLPIQNKKTTEEIKMSLGFTLLTLAEVAVGLFIVWGFWNEEKMVEFEDRFFARIGLPRRKKRTAKITRFDSTNQTHRETRCI